MRCAHNLYMKLEYKIPHTYLGVIITINLLETHNKIPCRLSEVLQTLYKKNIIKKKVEEKNKI